MTINAANMALRALAEKRKPKLVMLQKPRSGKKVPLMLRLKIAKALRQINELQERIAKP
jgi:hypothetical protein